MHGTSVFAGIVMMVAMPNVRLSGDHGWLGRGVKKDARTKKARCWGIRWYLGMHLRRGRIGYSSVWEGPSMTAGSSSAWCRRSPSAANSANVASSRESNSSAVKKVMSLVFFGVVLSIAIQQWEMGVIGTNKVCITREHIRIILCRRRSKGVAYSSVGT